MLEGIIWLVKGIILTCVLTNAMHRWGIFNPLRAFLKTRSTIFCRLLSCYECCSVWAAFLVFSYLFFLDTSLITYPLIFQWVATNLRILLDLLDAKRAVKEKEI